MRQQKATRLFYFFGPRGKYSTFTWWENFFSGHINIGKNITIYGENAMHWSVNIRSKKYGWICFTLPVKTFGKYWGCHLYFSPNGTPSDSTYYKSIWKENRKELEIAARIRKLNFGHNFNPDVNQEKLRILNNKFSSFYIWEYDVEKHREQSANYIQW